MRGDIVAVVETDKGAVEVEIWEEGTVESLLVQPGTKVPVGEMMATLRGAEAAAPIAPPRLSPRRARAGRGAERSAGARRGRSVAAASFAGRAPPCAGAGRGSRAG